MVGGSICSTLNERRLTRSLQPTCYPYDYSTVSEDGELFDSSSRHDNARTRLNSALTSKSNWERHVYRVLDNGVLKQIETWQVVVPQHDNDGRPFEKSTIDAILSTFPHFSS
jgi:hypothetical protein